MMSKLFKYFGYISIQQHNAICLQLEQDRKRLNEKDIREAREDGKSVFKPYFELYHHILHHGDHEWEDKFNKLVSVIESCKNCAEIAFDKKLWRTNWHSGAFEEAWKVHLYNPKSSHGE